MDKDYLRRLLEGVAKGSLSCDDAMLRLKTLDYEEMGFAILDQQRNLRTGYPETVFCQGKTPEQIADIMAKLGETNAAIMGTRASEADYKAVKEKIPHAVYHKAPAMITISSGEPREKLKGTIAIVTAGTADIPVAEEAAITAEMLDNQVERIYDVGVAGIHRLFAKLDRIRQANVVIVVAGMEGALASVVGGLTEGPVIAVPASVGYGANFGGLSALLSMLNSCATGVTTVNIDNGFGAGHVAATINRRINQGSK